MKRIFAAAIVFLALVSQVQAVATPSATSTANKQVEDLKERLATKVAELKKVERKAVFGKVKSVSISSVTIETKTKNLKIELPDTVVVIQYLKGQRTKLTTGDIDKDDMVAVFGEYDATVDILKASVIVIQNTVTQRVTGTITAIDKTDYTLTMTGDDGKTYVMDIETTTKAITWDQTSGITKWGFSKMNIGNFIEVLGSPVPKKENRLSAVRILDLGNSSTSTTTSAPSPTPSSASASATPTKLPN